MTESPAALRVVLDDVIYQVQSARGATMYWRHLSQELESRTDVEVIHREAQRHLSRYAPLLGVHGLVHTSLFRWTVPTTRAKLVMTVHDLAYERGMVPGARSYVGRAERLLSVARADGIVCPTAATAADVVDVYGRVVRNVPIVVAHHGPSVPVTDVQPLETRNPSGALTLLHVGHRDGYKNFAAIQRAIATRRDLADRIRLLVVGPEPAADETLVQLAFDGDSVDVPEHPGAYYLGRVSNDTLASLYRTVDGLVSASRFEGFGLPVLDAIVHGCPVWCSGIPPHREIGGDVPTYFDPDDLDSISSALDTVVAEPGRLPNRIVTDYRRRFTWERSAAQHVALYRKVAGVSDAVDGASAASSDTGDTQ